MLFTTPEQFIVLAVILVGGWLIGFASAPSPKRWKRRVREQSDSFTQRYAALEEQRHLADRRAAELKSERDRLRDDNAEAERTIAGLRAAAVAAPVAPVAAEPARPALTLVEARSAPDPDAAPPASVAKVAPVPAAQPPEAVATQVSAAPAPIRLPPPAPDAVSETATPDPAGDDRPAEHAVAEHAAREPVAPDASPDRHSDASPAPATAPATGQADPAPSAASQPSTIAPMTPHPIDAPPAPIGPAEPEMPSKGWFASSARDDLTRIRGIDGVLNTRLFALGVVRFEDLEKLSAEDEMALEQRLALPVGYIAREQWRAQSALLRAGQVEDHAAHFPAAEPEPVQ